MRASVFAFAFVLLSLATLSSSMFAADEPIGFEYSLFDGKSLAGWTVENTAGEPGTGKNACQIKVDDGTILMVAGNGWLRSDMSYSDFVLHVEWQALQTENWDAGIYIRTLYGGAPFPRKSYQLNLKPGLTGNIKNIPDTAPDKIVAPIVKPPGQWNECDITVVGDRVTLVMNGKQVYSVGGIKERQGYIGLQCEVPLGGQFRFRNVQIKELGHESIFNGRELTGWEGGGQNAAACWEAAEGILRCTGKPGPWLRSAKQYDNLNLRLEYRLAAGGNSGVYVRVPADGNHHRASESDPAAGFEVQVLDDADPQYKSLQDYQYSASLYDIAGATPRVSKPAGQWNTLEIDCRGQSVKITHNGQAVVDASADKQPLLALRSLSGFLGLQNHSTPVEFRRLRVGPTTQTK